ncbi:importin subunit alpha-1/8 [Sarotherodon galilaeus]
MLNSFPVTEIESVATDCTSLPLPLQTASLSAQPIAVAVPPFTPSSAQSAVQPLALPISPQPTPAVSAGPAGNGPTVFITAVSKPDSIVSLDPVIKNLIAVEQDESVSSEPKDRAQPVTGNSRPTMGNKLENSDWPEDEKELAANSGSLISVESIENRFPCSPSEDGALIFEAVNPESVDYESVNLKDVFVATDQLETQPAAQLETQSAAQHVTQSAAQHVTPSLVQSASHPHPLLEVDMPAGPTLPSFHQSVVPASLSSLPRVAAAPSSPPPSAAPSPPASHQTAATAALSASPSTSPARPSSSPPAATASPSSPPDQPSIAAPQPEEELSERGEPASQLEEELSERGEPASPAVERSEPAELSERGEPASPTVELSEPGELSERGEPASQPEEELSEREKPAPPAEELGEPEQELCEREEPAPPAEELGEPEQELGEREELAIHLHAVHVQGALHAVHVQRALHVQRVGDHGPFYTVVPRSCTAAFVAGHQSCHATGPVAARRSCHATATRSVAGHRTCSAAATGSVAGPLNRFLAAAGPMAVRRRSSIPSDGLEVGLLNCFLPLPTHSRSRLFCRPLGRQPELFAVIGAGLD